MDYKVLDASLNIQYHSIYEAINDVMGTELKGWMKACYPHWKGNGTFRLWFPKLAKIENGKYESTAYDCINYISDDWNEFIFDDLKGTAGDMSNKFRDYDLIFAKDVGGEYVFRGVYVRDEEKSKPNHDVSKRVASKVKIIRGIEPSIELLD